MNIFHKPKIIIPIFVVIAIGALVLTYRHIGVAPVVTPLHETTSDHVVASGSTVDLGFPKGGRVESVMVKSGQVVHKGDVLARLQAPDAQGLISQAKGALDLARAQFASLNAQYATTKKQQDLLVANAYNTLLTTGLEGVPSTQDRNVPIISGTYSCGKEGSYIIKPYSSGESDSGYSFNYTGIESGTAGVKYDNAIALGTCGLQIKFTHVTDFNPFVTWTINIPNTKSASYNANKNAYDAAVTNREKVLADLATNIGSDSTSSVAKAQVSAAEGAYAAALGVYQSNVIAAPVDGTVTFVDTDLKVGQSITANNTVISITAE